MYQQQNTPMHTVFMKTNQHSFGLKCVRSRSLAFARCCCSLVVKIQNMCFIHLDNAEKAIWPCAVPMFSFKKGGLAIPHGNAC